MDVRGITPILNVSSIEASAAWFEALGWHLRFSHAEDGGQAGFAAIAVEPTRSACAAMPRAPAVARLRSFPATSKQAASG
jgi:hypothetical protein